MLGLFLRQEARQLIASNPGEPAILEEVIVVDSKESEKLHGLFSSQISKYPYLQNNPALLEINGENI